MSKERWSMFCKQPLSSWTFEISSSASKTGTGCEMMTSTFNHRRQVTCSVTVTEFLRLIKRPEQTLNLQDISCQNKTCSSDVWRTNCSFYSHVSIGTCWRGWGWGRVWGCEGEGGRGMSTPSQLWLLLYHLSRVQSLNLCFMSPVMEFWACQTGFQNSPEQEFVIKQKYSVTSERCMPKSFQLRNSSLWLMM